MNEKLKKKILDNEELLELLLAVHFNNKTTEDNKITYYETDGDFSEPFKPASYMDIEYNIALLNKWKNSNAIDKLNEAIKENPKEATEENLKDAKKKYELIAEAERGLYLEEVKFLEKYLNKTFLNKAYYVFVNLLVGSCVNFIFILTDYFYLIDLYKGTELAEELRNKIKDIIEEEEVNTINTDIIKEKKEDYNTFYHNVRIGIAFSELLINTCKGSILSKEVLDKYVELYKEDNGNILEDIKKTYTEDEDAIAEYLLEIKDYLRIEKLLKEAGNELVDFYQEKAKKYGITDFINDADLDKLNELATNKLYEVNKTIVENIERTKDFKNEAVRKVVSIFALDITTKRLATSVDVKENIEKKRKEAYKTFNELEPIGNEYVMSAVNTYSSAIKKTQSTIATYNENNIEVKERTIKNLNKRIEILENKDILTDAEIKELDKLLKDQEQLEEDIKKIKKGHKKIEKEIEELKKEVLDLSKEYEQLEEKGLSEREKRIEKRKITNNIKKNNLRIETLKKAKGSRGLYLQLAMEEDKNYLTTTETFKGGSITMYIEDSIEGLSNYNREALNLLRYLDGIAYTLPFEQYKKEDIPILIDLDDYVAETGRKASAYKSVKEQLIEAVELLQKEFFRIDGKAHKYNLDIKGRIEIVGDYYIVAPSETVKGFTNSTRKTTVMLFLGHTYKQILFNEKMMQWASVPRLLNKLKDKEIKEEGYTIKKELVQDLGYYIYEEIKRDLNERSKETKGQFKGYYKLTRYIKTIVEHLYKSNALASNKNNTYVKRVIKPLEEAFTYLADLGLIEIKTKAFSIYYGDEELGEKGLKNAKEEIIKKAFEEAKITIIFKVINEEAYDRIIETKTKYKNKAKKVKKKETEQQLLTLFEDAELVEAKNNEA